jgi:hypothetical protein
VAVCSYPCAAKSLFAAASSRSREDEVCLAN